MRRPAQDRMLTSETPENEDKQKTQPETSEEGGRSQVPEFLPPSGSSSRWINYDAHELLDRISDLEDERRWARLREGILWAILAHLALLLAVVLLPRYVLHAPPVVDQNALKDKDFTYLDSPSIPAKPAPKLKPLEQPQLDKKTLEEMRKQSEEQQRSQTPTPQQQQPEPQKPQPQPQTQATPQPQPKLPMQAQQEPQAPAAHPSPVPAKPSFAMGPQNPQDQLREAMKGAAHNRGGGSPGVLGGSGGLRQHPGASGGGVQVLSDTQGVDFNAWLHAWYYETQKTWDPLIPDEVNPPILKSGQVMIRFKVLPNGRLMPGSLVLEGRSGDVALDRAAWGALTGSNYPGLPHDFHGPYLELRAVFLYNEQRR